MIGAPSRSASPAMALALATILAGCGASSGTPHDVTVAARHDACFISGSLTQCYDDWALFDCVSPNRYVQDTTCAQQGLCQDACSGTWLDCSDAATTCPPPTSPPSSTCISVCAHIFDCRQGAWFYFLQRVDADNCPSLCSGWDATRIECIQRQSCPYLSGATPACLSTPNKACDDCLASCRGLSGCCTGEGCICQSQC
jgi:hypothetical protein